ncbi:cytochrome P450 [Mycena filopes]|nr:cytochrome P450 [Mycena filopes]
MDHYILEISAAAGFASWAFFHYFPMRGDHVALAYGAAVFAVYASALFAAVGAPVAVTIKISCVYAWSTLLWTALYRISPWHKLADYPGPFFWRFSSLPLVLASFRGKRYILLDKLHEKYGDFVRIGPDSLSIKRKSANTIIYGAGTHMEKSDSYATPGHPKAVALFFKQATRELHTERKKVWSPAFTGPSIANFLPVLEKRTTELLHCLERRQKESPDGYFDISKALSHWAYDMTSDILFGGCISLELMQSGDPDGIVEGGKFATVLLDSFGLSPWLIDLAWHLPVGKAQVRLRDECAQMMQTRVQKDSEVMMRDITSYFLDAGDARPPLEDMQVDAVVATQGGSDNTSTTTSLACYYMLSTENGRQWQKLRAELDAACPDPAAPLSWDTLASLPYLNAVINEALRLGSPYYLPRMVGKNGVIIDDMYVPEGVSVAIAAYSLQTSAENFYPDPMEYRAERWLPGGLGPGSVTDRSVLYSFSSGPHMCIGKVLAYYEMRIALARIVLAFDLEFAPDFDPKRFRDGIQNMRTTLFEVPLKLRARRRPGAVLPA